MPQNGVYDLLKMLDLAIDEGYTVFKYTIVNKKEIEALIDRIYSEMNFDNNVRAQELSLEKFIKIYKLIYER